MEKTQVEVNPNSVKVEEKETYFNRETAEILTNPLEIAYYKNLQLEQIADNNLLGEFDKKGNYEIKKEILLELISVKKFIKEAKDNKYILSSPIKESFDNLVFTLLIEDELDKQVATLRIIETDVKPSGEKELLKTIIGKYKDDKDIYFLTKIKKLFNIVDAESDGKEINNEEFLKIILKKLQDFKSLKRRSGLFESIAKNYIDKIIEIMKNNPGQYSEYILRYYDIYLAEMQELTDKPQYYQKLKYKLDALLNGAGKKIKDPVINSLINEARKEFLKQVERVREETLNPKPIIAKPKEKTVAKKPSQQSSSKAGGAPGKKKVSVAKKPAAKAASKTYPAFKKPESFVNESKPKENKQFEEKLNEALNQQKVDLSISQSLFSVVSTSQIIDKVDSVTKRDNYKKNNQSELVT